MGGEGDLCSVHGGLGKNVTVQSEAGSGWGAAKRGQGCMISVQAAVRGLEGLEPHGTPRPCLLHLPLHMLLLPANVTIQSGAWLASSTCHDGILWPDYSELAAC